MKISLSLLFILSSLFVASPTPVGAENQTWKVRPGDTLEVIATTLDISKEEIKQNNPGVLENNLQIGQKLKLPLRSYHESKTLEQDLRKRDQRIGELERKSGDLEGAIASAESQLGWHPVWLWGFWVCFAILVFIVSVAYWVFHQTHPRVFEEPHDRSLRDLQEGEKRFRSFTYEEEDGRSRSRHWQPPLKRIPSHR